MDGDSEPLPRRQRGTTDRLLPFVVGGLVLLGIVAMISAVTARTETLQATAPPTAAATASTEPTGDPEAGADVFARYCATCHGPRAQGRGSAPSLIGVLERHTVDEVRATIHDGRAGMPAFGTLLSEGDIDDVIAGLDLITAQERANPQRRMPWGGMPWDGMPWHGPGGMGWGWGWALVWMVLVPIAIILAVVWLVRSSRSGGSAQAPPPTATAREELDRRYARGEIDRDAYLQARGDLEQRPD